jgi:hypothetical protein
MDIQKIKTNQSLKKSLEKIIATQLKSGFLGILGVSGDDTTLELIFEEMKTDQDDFIPVGETYIKLWASFETTRKDYVGDEYNYWERMADSISESIDKLSKKWPTDIWDPEQFYGVGIKLNDEVVY